MLKRNFLLVAVYFSLCTLSSAGAQDSLALPDQIKLKGALRSQTMSSSLGTIDLRWPRAVEELFGRTPERAMADAAQTMSRAIKRGGFPTHVSTLDVDWKVVFMDENLPAEQIPYNLISDCHPAWMTPPANIYVVAQRAAKGCGTSSVTTKAADAQLTQILLHELGHAVEYHLLKGQGFNDRIRAEGFATWIEQYASDMSAIIPHGKVNEMQLSAARQSFQKAPGPKEFTGSFDDYVRASMIFRAIVDRRGVSGLCNVYDVMVKNRLPFAAAVEKSTGWDQRKIGTEIARMLN